MIRPFFRETDIGVEIGASTCRACKAGFEIDDRGEGVFVDTASPRMPVFGQVPVECGLVQEGKRDSCLYCGTTFDKTAH